MLIRCYCALIFCCALLFSVNAFAINLQAQQAVKPADVLYQLHKLSIQLRAIQHFVGKTDTTPNTIVFSHVAPREVYFLAQALYERANRFGFEITGVSQLPPAMEQQNITPKEVLQLINAVGETIQRVA